MKIFCIKNLEIKKEKLRKRWEVGESVREGERDRRQKERKRRTKEDEGEIEEGGTRKGNENERKREQQRLP